MASEPWEFVAPVANGGQVFAWRDRVLLVTERGRPFSIECALDGEPVFKVLESEAGPGFSSADVGRWFHLANTF